jgi:hypothetical protein
MAEEKSILEEAIIQMKNLEEAVAENAKGILGSVMTQEIKDLVKESLNEQDDEEEVEDDEEEFDVPLDMDDFEDEEDDEIDFDSDEDEEEEIDFDSDEEDETIDLTNAPTSEVLKVFKLMGPEDEIVVTKDDSHNIHLKDNDSGKEYMIVGESDEDYFDDEYYSDEDEEDYFGNEMSDGEMDETLYEIEMEEGDKEESFMDKHSKDETLYEIEMEEGDYMEGDYMEGDYMEGDYMEESLYESKKTMKPKGYDLGSASKFKYSKKPNMEGGFDEDMKEGDKSKFTGSVKKAKVYGKSPSFEGKYKEVKSTKKKGEHTEGKKVEAKEASRTYGMGSKSGRGLRKGITPNRNLTFESYDSSEVELLRQKNEEYRKALNVFRNKLNEVAIFNSNLAYATRLFTEHSTSKQEKINILKRFDGVETLKESKNLYKTLKDELSGTKGNQISESIERQIEKAPSTGSAINLIESKTYENPQFLRMKDLMSKLK